ncbi:MAG TPA: hypothetical protein VJ044_08830 [Candidatus Hodarchaeales archaeon]|nr:hypothetical protein [Candidatus Hodarchaeales archaeon]
MTEKAKMYWRHYLESLPLYVKHSDSFFESFSFGTSPQDADDILVLVLNGTKTSTGSLKWKYDYERRPFHLREI